MAKYTVKSPIKIGTNDVAQPGDEIEFSAKEAKELLACGAIEEGRPVQAADTGKKKKD